MREMEIWIAVRKMIDLFEVDANWYAAFRADELREQDDPEGAQTWTKIGEAIEKLQPQKLVVVASND